MQLFSSCFCCFLAVPSLSNIEFQCYQIMDFNNHQKSLNIGHCISVYCFFSFLKRVNQFYIYSRLFSSMKICYKIFLQSEQIDILNGSLSTFLLNTEFQNCSRFQFSKQPVWKHYHFMNRMSAETQALKCTRARCLPLVDD